MDRQAEDRCHRLGQTRKVTVYRLVCAGTVDNSAARAAPRGSQGATPRASGLAAAAAARMPHPCPPPPPHPPPPTPNPPTPPRPPPPNPQHPADIYAIQQRKLRLDAAVLEGVTISTDAGAGDGGRGGGGRGRGRGGRGRGGVSAADARHMGAILAALLVRARVCACLCWVRVRVCVFACVGRGPCAFVREQPGVEPGLCAGRARAGGPRRPQGDEDGEEGEGGGGPDGGGGGDGGGGPSASLSLIATPAASEPGA